MQLSQVLSLEFHVVPQASPREIPECSLELALSTVMEGPQTKNQWRSYSIMILSCYFTFHFKDIILWPYFVVLAMCKANLVLSVL